MKLEDQHDLTQVKLTRVDVGIGLGAAAAIAGGTALGLTSKSNVAAVLAFVGAILVALLGAYWSQRRQTQHIAAADRRHQAQLNAETARQRIQLDAERTRQADALDSEAARLQLQLDHERQLHDLGEMREILDSAIHHSAEGVRLFADLTAEDLANDKRKEVEHQITDHQTALSSLRSRFDLRGFSDLGELMIELSNLLTPPAFDLSQTPAERSQDIGDAFYRLGHANGTFIASAASLVRSKLPGGERAPVSGDPH